MDHRLDPGDTRERLLDHQILLQRALRLPSHDNEDTKMKTDVALSEHNVLSYYDSGDTPCSELVLSGAIVAGRCTTTTTTSTGTCLHANAEVV